MTPLALLIYAVMLAIMVTGYKLESRKDAKLRNLNPFSKPGEKEIRVFIKRRKVA